MINIRFKNGHIKLKYKDKNIFLNNRLSNMIMNYQNISTQNKLLSIDRRITLENRIIQSVDSQYELKYIIEDSDTLDKEELWVTDSNIEGIEGILSTKWGKEIGIVRKWCDNDNEIPEELKNQDNIVRDPETNEDIIEIEIFGEQKDICSLPKKIYREYRFLHPKNLQPTYEIDIQLSSYKI